jgi:hypothetical protein
VIQPEGLHIFPAPTTTVNIHFPERERLTSSVDQGEKGDQYDVHTTLIYL